MPSHVRQNGSRNISLPSRANSVASDAALSSKAMQAPPCLHIRPSPAYVAAAAAAELATDHQRERIQDRYPDDDGSFTDPDGALFTEPALATINTFLDQLLFSFLASARSTTLSALRPAIEHVLKGKLARQAIEGANDELQELLGEGEEEEELQTMQNNDETTARWDTNAVWKRTRLRIMVYTRLGELEDEDEERYVEEEGLNLGEDDSKRYSQHSSLVSWSAAIFLTSVLEFIAEQCLAVAAQAAYDRSDNLRGPKTSRPSTRDGDEDRVVIAEHDVERVALNSSLGRLWRTWRKSSRSSRRSGLTSGSSSRRPSVSSNRLTSTSHRDGESRSRSGTVASKTSSRDLLATPASALDVANQGDDSKVSTEELHPEDSAKEGAIKRVKSLLSFPESSTTPAEDTVASEIPVVARYRRSYSMPEAEPTSMQIFLRRLMESQALIEAKLAAQAAEAEKAAAGSKQTDTPSKDADQGEEGHKTKEDDPLTDETHIDDTTSQLTLDEEREMEAVVQGQDSKYVHEGVGEQPEVAQTIRVRSKPSGPTTITVFNQQSSPPRTSSRTRAIELPKETRESTGTAEDTTPIARETFLDTEPQMSRATDDRPEEIPETIPEETVSDERSSTPPAAVVKQASPELLKQAEVSPRTGKTRPKAIKIEPGEIDMSMFPPTPKHAPGDLTTKQESIEPAQPAQKTTIMAMEQNSSQTSDERRRSSGSSKYSTAAGSMKTTASKKAAKASQDLSRTRRSADNNSEEDIREKDFDELMKAEETLKYTLTPKNLRNFEETNGLGIKQPPPTITKTEPPAKEPYVPHESQTTQQQPRALRMYPESSPGSNWSGPSDLSTAVIADASTLSIKAARRLTSRPPASNSQSSKYGLVAREPRIQTESTRDFADFIRSTAPDGRILQPQPILATSSNTPLRSAVVSPLMSRRSSLDLKTGPKTLDPSASSIAPPLRSKGSQQKFEPREPIVTKRVDKDLIEFFRQGPPSSGASVARKPMPPESSSSSLRPKYSNSALRANLESLTYSVTDSANSQASLLPGARQNGHRHGLPDASQVEAPVRKQRRVKDPYALDLSDDESDDVVTALRPKQETLADFLNTSEPPQDEPEPPSRTVSSSKFGSRRGRKLGGKHGVQPTPVSEHPPQIPFDFASSSQRSKVETNEYSQEPLATELRGAGMKGFFKKMGTAA